ncbi:hypothetical protein [Gordonia sp. (in: high G+C Gram-positive bacteria)]|uniref:hypothetical protein n=1 Tax=Gordonia sp. (in: high G+C Gram-positive bacteria) TaxID=84139 RepID=UPI0039E25123
MKKLVVGLAAAAVLATMGIADAEGAPSSVPREGGPCYPSEPASGDLYCSGESGTWKSRSVRNAPKVQIGSACPQLGKRAIVVGTHGEATCKQSVRGLTWQW